MPGRRTDRINRRDLEVLEFIGRYGIVPRDAVAAWAGSGRTVTYERERRLRGADLIRVRRGFDDDERLLIATFLGLRACGRRDLREARPSPATIDHEATAARLGARLELGGHRVLSEREILAAERSAGEAVHSAEISARRFHRPDLILLGEGEETTAIEVELSAKGAARLDAILRAWRLAVAERRLSGVVYHCVPRTRRLVEASIERTATAQMIGAVDLEL